MIFYDRNDPGLTSMRCLIFQDGKNDGDDVREHGMKPDKIETDGSKYGLPLKVDDDPSSFLD